MITKTQGIWGTAIASAFAVLYTLYLIYFAPPVLSQTNAIGSTYKCAMLMNETNITEVELFLNEVNSTIQKGKTADVMISAALPVKTDPKQGSGQSLEECSKSLTDHLNELKIQQSYQR